MHVCNLKELPDLSLAHSQTSSFDPPSSMYPSASCRWASRQAAIKCVLLVLQMFFWASLSATQHVQADRIVIVKSARTMTLFSGGKVLKIYKVALGGVPVGAKQVQGDHKTPEGEYTIDSRKLNSQFHRALHISYPNVTDRERAHKLGQPPEAIL